MRVLISLLVTCCAILQRKCEDSIVSYTGYRVVRFTPETEDDLKTLTRFLKQNPNIDIWKEGFEIKVPIDLNLSPEQYRVAQEETKGVKREIRIEDVQHVIDQQTQAHNNMARFAMEYFDYGRYHDLQTIYRWIDMIAAKHRGMVTVFKIAESTLGKPIKCILIRSERTRKPAFYFQGGIHAREWISPATVIYMTAKMLDNYKRGTGSSAKMVDMFDWFIVPVANPDGYEYTWTTNRLWRKTRSRNINSNCVGVDPNRNWNYQWGTTGISHDPCSNVYCGPKPFSEPETRDVADFLLKMKNLTVFIDIHAYSQMWMSPWGYTRDCVPIDFKIQNEASEKAVWALANKHGTKFTHGTIARTIYEASGGTVDWAYAVANVTFSHTPELRDRGQYGFLLPHDQIIPTGEETFEAFKAYAKVVHDHVNKKTINEKNEGLLVQANKKQCP